MIKFYESNYNRRDFLRLALITLAVLVGFWNISLLLLPLALGLLFFIITTKGFRTINIPAFSGMDAGLALLLLVEIINYYFSIYPPNGLISLEKLLVFIFLYYAVRIILIETTSRQFFFTSLGTYAFLLALGAFFTFLLLQTQLQLEGWQDAAQFKRLFSPFGLLSNEWATIALCLLPFPLVAAAYFRSVKIAWAMSIFAFAVVNVSVLISFSRGAYLSLGVFWLATIMSILYLKILPVKSVLQSMLIIAILTILLMIPARTPFFTTLAMNKTVSQQRSTQGRLDIMQDALCQAKGHLIMGVGANNYPIINDLCKTPRADQGYSGFTNNTYLQILIEKGVIGLMAYGLFFLIIIIGFIKNIIRETDQTARFVIALLLAGFLTFCFRELFFSSFLYSNGVLTLVSVFAAASTAENDLKSRKGNSLFLIFSVMLLLITTWALYQKNNYRQAEYAVKQAISQGGRGEEQAVLALANVTKAIELTPKAAPYHALAGLIEGQTNAPLSVFFKDSLQFDTISIIKAITHFTNALQYNPLDASFHFNLGWLRFLENRHAKTGLEHLDRALELEPNNPEFLIGKGIVLEYLQDTIGAFDMYKSAIRIDPEILDSKFLNDLIRRHPDTFKEISEKAANDFEANPSTIISARLGKILLHNGNMQAAKTVLQRVTQELPDLNRPYYHLAIIAEREGDTTQAMSLLRKAAYLDRMDYLPVLELGNIYYNRPNDQKNTAFTIIRYYQSALQYWLNSTTSHHARANIKYRNNNNVNNDLIPKDLLFALKTQIDFQEITTRIAEMYVKLGNKEGAQYYQALSQKALQEIKAEDIR